MNERKMKTWHVEIVKNKSGDNNKNDNNNNNNNNNNNDNDDNNNDNLFPSLKSLPAQRFLFAPDIKKKRGKLL